MKELKTPALVKILGHFRLSRMDEKESANHILRIPRRDFWRSYMQRSQVFVEVLIRYDLQTPVKHSERGYTEIPKPGGSFLNYRYFRLPGYLVKLTADVVVKQSTIELRRRQYI